MKRTLIVYETKNGYGEVAADQLALVLGPSKLITPAEFCSNLRGFDCVTIGSPVKNNRIMPQIKNFIFDNLDWLKTKNVALFTVCSHNTSGELLSDIKDAIGDHVVWSGRFAELQRNSKREKKSGLPENGGLISEGYSACELGKSFADKAIELKRALYDNCDMPKDKLKKKIADFLMAHKTCVLCTGHGSEVRATPIEYLYSNEAFYFFSEGGEKFAHLSINRNVSIAIHNDYEGFQKLAGLQIAGKAEIVAVESEEFLKAMSAKGLNYDKIKELPVKLNVLKVSPIRYEFLCSEFKLEGYDAKQTLSLS